MTTSIGGTPRWRPALALAIAAVILSALLNVGIASRLRVSRERTQDSEDTLREIAALRAHLVDAETGQRGYLLTGDPAYLEPYRTAHAKVRADLDSLTRQSDAPDGLGSTPLLRALAARKLAELDETVALRDRNDRDSALAIVRSNRGRLLMDSVRALTRSLTADQVSRLADQRASEDRLAATVLLVLLGSAAALIGVVWYLWTTLRDYDASQRAAQREMERQLADLETVMRQHAATGGRTPDGPPSADA